jgi:hypothetical protein
VKLDMVLMIGLSCSLQVTSNIYTYYVISVSMMLFGKMRHRWPD